MVFFLGDQKRTVTSSSSPHIGTYVHSYFFCFHHCVLYVCTNNAILLVVTAGANPRLHGNPKRRSDATHGHAVLGGWKLITRPILPNPASSFQARTGILIT